MPEAVSPEELHQRRMRAMELRRKGYSYPMIVQELRKEGWWITLGQAFHDVNFRIKQMIKEEKEEAEHIREIELARLDVATKAITARVEAGDDDAIQTMLKIQVRRAKLLGLDAPTKREIDDKRDKVPRSRQELMTSLVTMTKRLEAMGVKLLPSADIINAETTQSAIEISDEKVEKE